MQEGRWFQIGDNLSPYFLAKETLISTLHCSKFKILEQARVQGGDDDDDDDYGDDDGDDDETWRL